jgi:hypothetical protein
MVKPVSFLCLLAFVIMPLAAQAQDQGDGDGAAINESTLSFEGPPDDGPEQVTTIILRIDRNNSAFPASQLPTSQLPQSQLPQSTAFPTER